MVMTDAKHHEMQVAKNEKKFDFHLLPDSIVSFDRGYLDFTWLYSLEKRGVWFVTRAKKNLQYRVTGQHHPIQSDQVTRDEQIELTVEKSRHSYPKILRLVSYTDPETGKEYE